MDVALTLFTLFITSSIIVLLMGVSFWVGQLDTRTKKLEEEVRGKT